MQYRWTPLPLKDLPEIGESWMQVELGSLSLPGRLHSSLISALTREYACLARLPDGNHLLLLRVRLPILSLRNLQDGTHLTLNAERVRQDKCWFLTLHSSPGEAGCNLPAGRLTITSDHGKGRWLGLRIGDRAEIVPAASMRRWDWAWSPTIGPVSLRIYVDRSQEQLEQWLAQNVPASFSRNERGVYCSRETQDWWLYAGDGLLYFAHGYHTVPIEQFAADQVLLSRLTQGELGELSFDLFDGDYLWLTASGHGCASLLRYLTPSRFKAGASHPWNRNLDLTIDVRDATAESYLEAVRKSILSFAKLEDSQASLADLLRQTPLDQLPRRVSVLLPFGVRPPDSARSPITVNRRIFWQWQMGPFAPDQAYVTVSE
jgi:hypothetical protein